MESKSFHDDTTLHKIIDLDIDRTFQIYKLFKDKSIKLNIHNILYIYSKINYDVSYKQGMNELLATLVLVMYPYYHKTKLSNKHEILLYKVDEQSISMRDVYSYLFDEDEFEADIFSLFNSLMQRGLKDMYYTPDDITKNDTPLFKKRELFHSKWEKTDDFKDIEIVEKLQIQQKCDKIFKKLEKVDKEVYRYLDSLELDTHIVFS
jgi:hypothetical protein